MRLLRLGFVVVVVLVCSGQYDPYDPGDLFDTKTVSALFGEAERAVAAELNVELKERPRLLLSSRDNMVKLFMRELPHQLAKQAPERAGDKKFVRRQAHIASRGVLGYYDAHKHTIHIVPDNFIDNAKSLKDPRFLDDLFLETVLVHELVHAWDVQMYDVVNRSEAAASASEYRVWYALIEGHAQFTTQRVMTRLNAQKHFFQYAKTQYSVPPGLDPSMQHHAEVKARRGRFGYVDGHAFFERLSETKRTNFVKDVFTEIPSSPSVILHPQRYYKPPKRPFLHDYGPTLRVVLDRHAKGWKSKHVNYDESVFQSVFGTLIAHATVEELGSRFVGGNQLAASDPKTKSTMICTAVQMETPRYATRVLSTMLELQEAEETMMRIANGAAKVTHRETAHLELVADTPHTRQVKVIKVGDRTIKQHWVAFAQGSVYGECLFEGSARSDEELTKLVDTFTSQLKGVAQVRD